MARPSILMLTPPVIFAAMGAMFYIGMYREDPNALPSALVGREVPPIELTDLGAEPAFTDADLREGGVKLVNFWASWCGPCRVEHPTLTQLAEEGVPIYGVNYKDSEGNALAFLEELGNPYEGMGADERGRTALDWGLYGVPETYVLAADGTVILRFPGPVTQRVLEERIRPALEEAARR